jgi:hypothetical protein
VSDSEYDWRGEKALSIRAKHLALLEGSHEQEKGLHRLGIKGAIENYRRKCREALKLLDELRTLMVEKHPDSLNNLDD